MADILIRGVDMPDGCHNCGFSYFDKGETNGGEPCTVLMCSIINQGTNGAEYNGNRPSWCPLVPLPEGHGDLIEKAEAYDRIMEQEGGNYIDMDSVGMGLEECQIFVPAEGGIKNGN